MACLCASGLAHAAYDPQESAAPLPQANPFLEALVRRAAAAVFFADAPTLAALSEEARAYEQANAPQLEGFRLSDNLLELAACLTPGRAERLEALDAAARNADSGVRQRLESHRLADPYLQARQIDGIDQWNRLAGWFNGGANAIAQLANGSAAALVGWILGAPTAWRGSFDYDEWDRKQRALYEEFLRLHPDDPLARNVRPALDRLNRRHEKEMAGRMARMAQMCLDNGRFEDALFFCGIAEEGGVSAADIRMRAEQSLSAARRDQARTLTVAATDDLNPGGGDAGEFKRLMALLLAEDAPALEEASAEFARRHPGSAHADEALYLNALAAGMAGRSEDQSRRLKALRSGQGGANMALHAQNVARSPAVNPEMEKEAVGAQLTKETWGFVVFGDPSPVERAALARQSQFYSRGFEQYVSAILIVDGLVRSLRVAFGGGPADDAARDASARWLRAEPDGEQARDLARWLAGKAERRGAYDLAAEYRALAGEDSAAAIARLREKHARDLLARIESIPDPDRRRRLLAAAADSFESPEYTARARQEAEEASEELAIRLSKAELAAMPGLWRGRGLNWPPAWFDGELANGELDDEGAVFNPPEYQEVVFRMNEPGGRRLLSQRLNDAAHEQTSAALQDSRLLAIRREAAETRGARQILPLEIRGSAGSAGLLVYPTLKPYAMNPEELPLYR